MNYKFQIDNQNKKDYIENIKSHFLDNLRHLPFAPSVQMNDVPPDVLTFDDYGEEEEKNQDNSGFNVTKAGIMSKEHQAEYYAAEKDVDRDDPDAMRPHKVWSLAFLSSKFILDQIFSVWNFKR